MLFGGAATVTVAATPDGGDDGGTSFEAVLGTLVREHLVDTARESMLVVDGSVRPGILVLIDDADWELEGRLAARITPASAVTLISTLHGG